MDTSVRISNYDELDFLIRQIHIFFTNSKKIIKFLSRHLKQAPEEDRDDILNVKIRLATNFTEMSGLTDFGIYLFIHSVF